MLDLFSTDQQNLQSPLAGGVARVAAPTAGEAYAATREANDRLDGLGADLQNQTDCFQQRIDAALSQFNGIITGESS